MPSVGRKFLMAGRGGLNLTHSEELTAFLARYGAARDALAPAVEAYPPQALRDWSTELGQPTFVGSSGRVFPQAMKASPLLRAWLRRLSERGVTFALRHRWRGWTESGALRFTTSDGEREVRPRATLLALGGASWPKLGSDGVWADMLRDKGVRVASFQPANGGFEVAWSAHLRERFAGQPLKGIALRFGDREARGEAMVTRAGLEGGAVYALSAPLRDTIGSEGHAILKIALRPDMTTHDLARRLEAPRGKASLNNHLRKALSLAPVAIALLQEAAMAEGVSLGALPPEALAERINDVAITLKAVAPLALAISTAGGISFDEIDDAFMLRKLPGVFVAGEMLDWEAPTGGYLLQATMATGRAAGEGITRWLEPSP
jgi:uncharacterized flavoprotein (TIGR03862 family)